MTEGGKGVPWRGKSGSRSAVRVAFFLVVAVIATCGTLGGGGAAIAPPVPPPHFTVTPEDNRVRLSWPKQPDSVLTAAGISTDSVGVWTGASRCSISGIYEGLCDQYYYLQTKVTPLDSGRVKLEWRETPISGTSLSGEFEITRADSASEFTAGVELSLSASTVLARTAAEQVMVVDTLVLPPDTTRFFGSWEGSGVALPGTNGLFTRQVEGVIVFTAPADGEVFADHTTPSPLTLDWRFFQNGNGAVMDSGTVTIPHADTLVYTFAAVPPDTVDKPFLGVALGAGTVTAGSSFAVQVWPSVKGGEHFWVEGRTFNGYAIWRSEVIDLSRPILVGKIRHCGAPAESVDFFRDLDTLEYFDREVHNGYPYYFAVTTSDAEIDSISPALWDSLRVPVYPRKVEWDSTYTSGRSPFRDASRAHAVPNPYKLSEEWEEGEPKIQFINLPPSSTVYVFTAAGDLVRTIPQTDPLGDRVSWNLRSESGRDVVSGIYLFKVESPYGEKVGRFVVIR